MPLGIDVGLSPGDFVLDGDPVFPPQQRGQSPLQPPSNFRPISIVLKQLNASINDATRYGGKPQPRRVCVRWGPSPLAKKGGGRSPGGAPAQF